MLDHNLVNYNGDYGFTNIECNIHLLRDLQKTVDNLGHTWTLEFKGRLEITNAERNQAQREENYLAWVTNFDLPFSNNLSERALRGVKSKMKIDGQFQSKESAGWYAAIKSYTETCMRNRINEVNALTRLCEGKPYTVAKVYAHQNNA